MSRIQVSVVEGGESGAPRIYCRVEGHFDFPVARDCLREFRRQAVQGVEYELLFDLKEVHTVESCSVGTLLFLNERYGRRKPGLSVIHCGSERVSGLLHCAHLGSLFRIEDRSAESPPAPD